MPINVQIILIFILLGQNAVHKTTIEHNFIGNHKNLIPNAEVILSKTAAAATAVLAAFPCQEVTAEMSISGICEGVPFELPTEVAGIDEAVNLDIRPSLICSLVATGAIEK